MNKKFLSLFILLSMLLSMVSSAAATPLSAVTTEHQENQPQIENLVARVYFTNQEDLNQLASRFDILEVNHDAGYVLVILTPEEYTSLQQAGYRMQVDEDKTRLLNKPFMAAPWSRSRYDSRFFMLSNCRRNIPGHAGYCECPS